MVLELEVYSVVGTSGRAPPISRRRAPAAAFPNDSLCCTGRGARADAIAPASAPGALAAWRPFVFEAVEDALAEIERQYPEYGALAVQQVGPSPERAVVQLCAVCHRDSTPPPR